MPVSVVETVHEDGLNPRHFGLNGVHGSRNEMRFVVIFAVILLWQFLASGPAVAALGDNEASIVADQEHMKATQHITRLSQYTVHEIQTPFGTQIREYVSAHGQVFAVTWKGPHMPDLEQILGRYFADYVSAARGKRMGRGPVFVQRPDLVVQSAGHMRAFFGRGYIPQLVPAGVDLNEIK